MLAGFLNVRRGLHLSFLCFSLAGVTLAAQGPGTAPNDSAQDPLQRPRDVQKSHAKKAESPYQRWVDEVQYIILPEERDAFKKLTNDSERATYVEIFWNNRNPHPESSENEYKEEYYRRVAFANERFSAGIPGWKTDRGRIYILHGPPDSIESHPAGGPYMRPATEGGGQTVTHPFEIWHYRHIEGMHEDVNIEFVDTCGCGAYELTIDPSLKDALLHVPNAGPTDPEIFGLSTKATRVAGGVGPSLFGNKPGKQFDDMEDLAILNAPPPVKPRAVTETVRTIIRNNLLPFDVRVDFVKGDNNTVLTPITIQVPNREVAYVAKDGVQRASLNFSGRVTSVSGRIVATFEEPLRLDIPADLLEKFASNASLYQEVLWLRPGHYRLDVMLKDMNGDKLGIFAHSIDVPDFSDTDRLSSSTLILADLMDPAPPRQIGAGSFVLGTNKVRPRVSPGNGEPAIFARGQKVNLWMQVYHLTLDQNTRTPSARVEYNVVNLATGLPVFKVVQTTNELGVAGDEVTLQQRVPPENLVPGDYEVTIKVDDRVAGQSIAAKARFVVK